jgi:C-terminal processing protease CtpA/Prc
MAVVKIIRSLLLNELSETKSIVFDIRNNGGGLIQMADYIPQLFVTHFKNGPARAIVSPLNKDIFANNTGEPDWKTAYGKVQPHEMYSPLVFFDPVASVGTLGQAYFKPVGVFTNANCYSACDMFAANMQDNSGAIVFGEDGNTGAGGANVVEYGNYLSQIVPKLLPPLPYASQLPHSAQNLRVSYRYRSLI